MTDQKILFISGSMNIYKISDKQILTKLYFRPDYRTAIVNIPVSYQHILDNLPPYFHYRENLDGKFDFIQYFVGRKEMLETAGPKLKKAMRPETILWISYPKNYSLHTNLNRDVIARMCKSLGLLSVAQVSIDEIWSAVRFKLYPS